MTIERLFRLPRPRRRRFRTRVLLGMLVVALVPLAALTVLVVADLGSVSQATVDETNRTILEDQGAVQQRLVDAQAKQLAVKVDSITAQLRQMRQAAQDRLRAQAALAATVPPLQTAGPMGYLSDSSTTSTVLVAQAAPLPPGAKAGVAASVAVTGALAPAMNAARAGTPGVRSVWVADTQAGVVRITPQIDVAGEIYSGQIDTALPLNHGDGAPFSALARRVTAATSEQRTWESEPVSPLDVETRPAFTATYASTTPGELGVTVFEPVGAGSHMFVGLDLDVRALVRGIAEVPASDQKGAYTMLVGSAAELIGGGDQAAADLGLGAGSRLPSQSPVLTNGLGAVLATGSAQTVPAMLGGVDRELFTSPIPLAHWVLVSSVPKGGLLPDQASLSRGIDSGIHHIIRQAIPLAIGLGAAAFLLATLLARRLVGPVRALTVAAGRLGSGNTEEPVPPQGDDEVGLLADSLERMRCEINANRDAILAAARELEGRVAARTTELRARNEELLALNALAGSLTRSLDPQTIVEGALDALKAIVPLRAARAYLYDSGDPVQLRITVDRPAERGRRGFDDGLAGVASAAVISHDLVMRPVAGGVLLAVPLGTGEGTVGALALVAREGWSLAGPTRALLRAVADQTALALRTAALSAEGRELAVLEERTRLAREIHDTIAQQLTAVVLQLEAADALVARDQGRARSAVVEARDLARSALQEARRSVWNLRPTTLDAGGLAAALAVEASRFRQRTGIPTRLRTEQLPRDLTVAPATEVAFFRIAQEALNNAAQHSRATGVELFLRLEADELVLSVRDDGAGFVATAERPGSFGLVGMAERARLVGAAFSVESAPGGGTCIEVRLGGAVAMGRATEAVTA